MKMDRRVWAEEREGKAQLIRKQSSGEEMGASRAPKQLKSSPFGEHTSEAGKRKRSISYCACATRCRLLLESLAIRK